MKKTRLLSMFIAVMMVLLITSSAMAETIVIGGAGPLTGGAAQYGISVEQGAQLYIDQINAELAASGSDTRFELIFEDNGGDDTEAQNVYYRLTESKGAVAFLGDVLSSNCKVVAECANEDGIPMVTASSTSYEITTDHPTVFRTCFLDPFQGVVMANYAKSKGYTKVAILYGNDDDYSIGLADSFEEQCKKNGMEVTAKESGSFSDMDFSAQLTKIASTNPEVVFLPFYGEQASMILSRAASIGMDVTFLGGDGISNIVDFMTDKKLLTKVVYCDHFDANSETEIPHKKGLEMIFQQFKELLAKEGVKEIEAKGKDFDPETMNAVMHIEDESFGENEVSQVFQAGFELNGKVLRHAIVQVAN